MSKWIEMTIAPAARSLEGRPLGMCCSVMLSAPSRLRLLELGSSFVTALGGTAATDDRPHELRDRRFRRG